MKLQPLSPLNASGAEDRAQYAKLGGLSWLPPGIVGLALLPFYPDSLNRVGIVAVCVFVTLMGAVLLAAGGVSIELFYATSLLTAVPLGLAVYFSGPDLAPSVGALYVPAATYCFYFYRPVWAAVVVVGLGISYGAALLALGEEPRTALVRWALVMTAGVSTGRLVAWLVAGTARLAAAEQAARETTRQVTSELEIERLRRLKAFVPPRLAGLISDGDTTLLQPHRAEVGVLFVDLRGFTQLSTVADPEDVSALLDRYYTAVGDVVDSHAGMIGDFAGDGVLIYVNDPIRCDNLPRALVALVLDLQQAVGQVVDEWRIRGYPIGYGIGMSLGHATVGVMGTEGRRDYKPVGRVVNLAARLSDEAPADGVVVDQRTYAEIREHLPRAPSAPVTLTLKGFPSPITAHFV